MRAKLETDRLTLREFAPSDAPFILRLLNEPGWLAHIGDRGVRTLDDAERYIRTGPMASYADHGFGLFLVATRAGGAPVGMCGLLRRPELDEPDLGFAFLGEVSGRGYATEAGLAVMTDTERCGLTRVLAITTSQNVVSARVLAKLGFRFERQVHLGTSRERVHLFAWTAP